MADPFAPFADVDCWLAWREEPRDAPGDKPTKVPYKARTNGRADATNPTHWATLREAKTRADTLLGNGERGGVGIVLGEFDRTSDTTNGAVTVKVYLCGIDLDSCIDEAGKLADWAARIVALLGTYAEVSPSGRGLKAFFYVAADLVRPFLDLLGVKPEAWGCKRALPGLDGSNHGPGIETYAAKKYFTVTWQIWAGGPLVPGRIAALDRTQLEALAALIPGGWGYRPIAWDVPPFPAQGEGAATKKDNTRSARALGAARRMQPDTYEEMCEGLRNHEDEGIRDWVREKGEPRGERELKHIWAKLNEGDEDAGQPFDNVGPMPPPQDHPAQEQPPVADRTPWPDPLDEAAYHGLAGEIARAIEPHTEADPAALLLQLLVAFGNVVGRSRYFVADGVRHYGNLFAVLVGRSAKGRKGTSWSRVRAVFTSTDEVEDWLQGRIMGGLSTGEGLIQQVRDRSARMKRDRKTGADTVQVIDEGVTDKRLLIIEAEFSRTLRVMLRDTSTLSAIIRDAWDGNNLHVLTKTLPLRATRPFVSMIGHTTNEDLRRYLQATEAANGFGNRFLYLCVERSKLLPHGGDREALRQALDPLVVRLRERLADLVPSAVALAVLDPGDAQGLEIGWADAAAVARWNAFYAEAAQEQLGMLGAITARGEAQVIRLAVVYAALDGAAAIEVVHLEAAIAVWRYCLASARHVFGDALGDATADTILAALRAAGSTGMSRRALHDLFSRNITGAALTRALTLLLKAKLATYEHRATLGRSVEVWRAVF